MSAKTYVFTALTTPQPAWYEWPQGQYAGYSKLEEAFKGQDPAFFVFTNNRSTHSAWGLHQQTYWSTLSQSVAYTMSGFPSSFTHSNGVSVWGPGFVLGNQAFTLGASLTLEQPACVWSNAAPLQDPRLYAPVGVTQAPWWLPQNRAMSGFVPCPNGTGLVPAPAGLVPMPTVGITFGNSRYPTAKGCPLCGSYAYVGAFKVECANSKCTNGIP